MAAIPASARALLTSGRLGHLVTLNRDGSPQLTCIWTEVEGDEIVTAHLQASQKVKNVRRDPRIVLSVESDQMNPIGLKEYLVVNGTARIEEGGAPELLQQLAYRYLGPDVKFPPMPNPPAGFLMRITPERFGGVGPWTSGE